MPLSGWHAKHNMHVNGGFTGDSYLKVQARQHRSRTALHVWHNPNVVVLSPHFCSRVSTSSHAVTLSFAWHPAALGWKHVAPSTPPAPLPTRGLTGDSYTGHEICSLGKQGLLISCNLHLLTLFRLHTSPFATWTVTSIPFLPTSRIIAFAWWEPAHWKKPRALLTREPAAALGRVSSSREACLCPLDGELSLGAPPLPHLL